jgi:hypothetical protein
MWDWLNTHSGALQAISAGVSAVIAWFLYRLTRRYVDLTGILAKSAEKQVEIAQLQDEATRHLESASHQQQQIMDQVSEKEREIAEQAKLQLSGMAARYLSAFAGLSTTRISSASLSLIPKIANEDLNAFRLAANQTKLKSFEDVIHEGQGLDFKFLAALSSRLLKLVIGGRGVIY